MKNINKLYGPPGCDRSLAELAVTSAVDEFLACKIPQPAKHHFSVDIKVYFALALLLLLYALAAETALAHADPYQPLAKPAAAPPSAPVCASAVAACKLQSCLQSVVSCLLSAVCCLLSADAVCCLLYSATLPLHVLNVVGVPLHAA
jgi:hypothetical protein